MVIVGAKSVIYEVAKPTDDRVQSKSGYFEFRWIKTVMPPIKKKWIKTLAENLNPAKKIDPNACELFPGRTFTFQQIKTATRNFHPSNKLGEGGFGSVYKGVTRNKVAIAVKKLSSNSNQGTREFLNEVGTISALNHPNLVRLLGCCTEKSELLLVYEYMENNSLADALFGNVTGSAASANIKTRLDWRTRFNICLGIAKGLTFLHEESELRLIHRDIKPSNVLLDKDLTAKISDFGLARRNKEEYTHITTKVAGTSGYMAPEYAMLGHLTYKADVYSFGVVMLEIVSGKLSTKYRANDKNEFLLDQAYVLKQNGNLINLIDPDLKMDFVVKEATRMLDLAILCTNPSPVLRPNMSEVISILEGKTKMKSLPLPPRYFLHDFQNTNALADLSLSEDSGYDNISRPSNPFFSPETVLDTPVQNPLHDISDENVLKEQQAHDEFGDDTYVFRVNDDQPIREIAEECVNKDGVRLLVEENVIITLDSLKSSNDRGACTTVLFMDHAPHIDENKDKFDYVVPLFDEDGKLHIECSDEEFETGCSEWKNSLVGCFVGDDSQPATLTNIVDQEKVEILWGVKGEAVSVISMENGYFLFQFSNVEDRIRVLESGPWHFEHRTMVLREWNWKFKFDKADEIKTLPIWVKIYDLPLFLWSSPFLCKVGSGLGIPLYSDQETKRKKKLDFARLCIEVDACKPLPESLKISVRGVDYEIKFKYDWKPLRCANCCTFGHKESRCVSKMKHSKQN